MQFTRHTTVMAFFCQWKVNLLYDKIVLFLSIMRNVNTVFPIINEKNKTKQNKQTNPQRHLSHIEGALRGIRTYSHWLEITTGCLSHNPFSTVTLNSNVAFLNTRNCKQKIV